VSGELLGVNGALCWSQDTAKLAPVYARKCLTGLHQPPFICCCPVQARSCGYQCPVICI